MPDRKWMHMLGWMVMVVLFCHPGLADAQVREIIATGEYVMGDGETMAVSEERARLNAIREAAQEAGIYVKSYTKVRNMALAEDEIEVIANHAMKVSLLDKSRGMEGNAVRFVVKIKAVVSEADIESNLRQAVSDRQAVEGYRKLREEFARQTRELEDLKKQLAETPKGNQKEVLAKIGENENQFHALRLLEDGLARISALNYADAETVLTRAIELNPKLARAYAARAEARLYYADKDHLLADINRAIELETGNAMYYAVRARINAFKANCSAQNPQGCEEAFADIDRSRKLEPGNPAYVMMQGELYAALNQFDRAGARYDEAVAMLPSSVLPLVAVNTYLQRADFRLHAAKGNYLSLALDDLNRAVSIIASPVYMTGDVKKVARMMKSVPKSEQEAIALVKEIWGMDVAKMSEEEKKAYSQRIKSAQDVLKNITMVYWERSKVLYEAGDVEAAEKDRSLICEWTGGEMLTYASGIIADADLCTPKGAYRSFGSTQKREAYQWFKQGQRLFGRNKYVEAIDPLSRALELDSGLTDAWISRAFAYEYGNPPLFDKAIADFTRALDGDPKNSRILYERGLAFWARSKDRDWNKEREGAKRDRELAEKDFSQVIRLKNDEFYVGDALRQRGRIYQTEQKNDAAVRDYLMLARSYGKLEWFVEAARMLEASGKLKDALRIWDEYIVVAKKQISAAGGRENADLEQKIAEAQTEKKRLQQTKKGR